MDLLHLLLDIVLHLDRHLVEMLVRFDVWIYALLFAIIFAETGFVITPFLPGDSLLFAAGALAAVDSSHTLRLGGLLPLLALAAIGGNTVNFWIARRFGAHRPIDTWRWVNAEYLHRAQDFFARHGGMAVVLSRFVPVVRTFVPFAAGLAGMPSGPFQRFNVAGGLAWIGSFLCGGYLFGNLPLVKANFGVVTVLIIVLSLVPLLWAALSERHGGRERGRDG